MLVRLAASGSGAAGGFFGFAALPIELPITTTLMFRSVCDIARFHEEQLGTVEAKLQCLSVFALGGGKKSEGAETGYYAVRAALAAEVKAAQAALAKGAKKGSEPVLIRLITAIASRFQLQVTEQAAAKAVPVLGAVLGAAINLAFMDHFQDMAEGHFTVRQLERKYGQRAVRSAYEAL